jgi:hypothetical protein
MCLRSSSVVHYPSRMQISRMLCCKISLLLQSVWRSSVCGGGRCTDDRRMDERHPLASDPVSEGDACRVWSHFKQPPLSLSLRRPWTFSHSYSCAARLSACQVVLLSRSGQTPLLEWKWACWCALESKCKHVRNKLGNCSCPRYDGFVTLPLLMLVLLT